LSAGEGCCKYKERDSENPNRGEPHKLSFHRIGPKAE
jgi:hypothetical protein